MYSQLNFIILSLIILRNLEMVLKVAANDWERVAEIGDFSNISNSKTIYGFVNWESGNPYELIRKFNSGRSKRSISTPSPQDLKIQARQNLNKPNFVDCSEYAPSIYEELPVGTSVLTVKATDLDQPEFGGTVSYSIVSMDKSLFSIDSISGLVTTKKIFDRDEPAREKEFYFTVRATDNGRPQLDAVCTIKVLILDVNDNPPIFHKYVQAYPSIIYYVGSPRDNKEILMRILATDIDDGNNGTIIYNLKAYSGYPFEVDFFDINSTNGQVSRKKTLKDSFPYNYEMGVVAQDKGFPSSKLAEISHIIIRVENSILRPPTLIDDFPRVVSLGEGSVDKNKPILTIRAIANTDDGNVTFELLNGQTEATNKDEVFKLEAEGENVTHLKLDGQLDYESVSEYTIHINASNKYYLFEIITIIIKVTDENDEKPVFVEVDSCSIFENEPIGASVMKVVAIDRDGTSPNNNVTYFLLRDEDKENFYIDSVTGEITTKIMFDREEQDMYEVTVIALDGSPSTLTNNGQPNEELLQIKIEIVDKNDNPPTFAKDHYVVEVDGTGLNSKVIEIRAADKDTVSELTYSITNGDDEGDFSIDSTSGVVRVLRNLDYEMIKKYVLTIKVTDSIFDVYTKVEIQILNKNNYLPEFEQMDTSINILEESIPQKCIFRIQAFDPDIGNRTLPQNISYFVEKICEEHFSVDSDGCVRVQKKLDRDIGTGGHPIWLITVVAQDEWGLTTTKLQSFRVLIVILTDINDNAPILNCTNPIVWNENQQKGIITHLSAVDYDLPENGPPFRFAIHRNADQEIKTLFSVRGKFFNAKTDNFDRELKKEYLVPITISDNGRFRLTSTYTLTVIIGDRNDNRMRDGESEILVYKYKTIGWLRVGRVFVEDLDDWDLPDKTFTATEIPSQFFNFDKSKFFCGGGRLL